MVKGAQDSFLGVDTLVKWPSLKKVAKKGLLKRQPLPFTLVNPCTQQSVTVTCTIETVSRRAHGFQMIVSVPDEEHQDVVGPSRRLVFTTNGHKKGNAFTMP